MTNKRFDAVRGLSQAFDRALTDMSKNATTRILERDYNTQSNIIRKIRELGFTNLINLTGKNEDASIALAFYAGNGLVVKVIPKDKLPHQEMIYHLPSITTHTVKSDNTGTLVIKTYPWLNGKKLSQEDVEKFRTKLNEIGLNFTNGDDAVRNIKRLPDQAGTLIGIDSNMFTGNTVDQDAIDQWHNYIHSMYPIYIQAGDSNEIPEKYLTENHDYMSLHDNEFITRYASFEHYSDGIHDPPKTEPQKQSFFSGLRECFLPSYG